MKSNIKIICVVVVYQCFISNVMVTGDLEALLYSKVHALLECFKHTRYFIKPIQFYLTLAWIIAGSHTLWHSSYKCLSTSPTCR